MGKFSKKNPVFQTKVLDNSDLNFQQDVLWPIRHQFESQNTSYAAVYGQWAQVFDNWIGQQVWVPFSGFAAAVMCRSDAVANPWTAPAGFARGTINSSDIAINPNQKQRDELSLLWMISPLAPQIQC